MMIAQIQVPITIPLRWWCYKRNQSCRDGTRKRLTDCHEKLLQLLFSNQSCRDGTTREIDRLPWKALAVAVLKSELYRWEQQEKREIGRFIPMRSSWRCWEAIKRAVDMMERHKSTDWQIANEKKRLMQCCWEVREREKASCRDGTEREREL
jgi:hypothetical protein